MAKRKNTKGEDKNAIDEQLLKNTHISGAGNVVEQGITETLEVNYMPYAMSVILSRAIPEIDGFKPSHRKLLYTMYKMGLLTGGRTKSANIVGQTMRLNPHGDAAIYETMVRLARGNESLLHPYVDSKGNFGKAYSRDMAYAASRYTEAKLEKFCAELFRDIEKDTVDFVDNYDNTAKEPTLFPVTFPSILLNSNTGIAVGMASNICSFNLNELCDTTIELIKNPDHNVKETLLAPDFVGGGIVLYDEKAIDDVYNTGRGGIKVRARYTYDKSYNCIDITEIPPTTTCEAIIEKIIEKVKGGSLKEIADVRDETGKNGLKITIDLKRGTDPDKLMQKLYKVTTLEDSFPCNFNVLINGMPRVCGVKELLGEWIEFRTRCVERRYRFDLNRAQDKLHLLEGLEKILLDIDKAIKIIRGTAEESEVVPNLMIGFGIDRIQAEFVAEIKLRHLNREYILKRLDEIENLKNQIAQFTEIVSSKNKIKKVIIKELLEIKKKYGQERKSEISYNYEEAGFAQAEEVPDYPVNLFFTSEGYFKKITPQSLRMYAEQKVKETDTIIQTAETTNARDLLFFSNKCQVYKSRVSDFADTKASALGEYIPGKLEFDEGEKTVYMVVTEDYSGYVLFFFENGKVAKIPLKSYETKNNRKKLIKAYSDKSPLCAVRYIEQDCELLLKSSGGRFLIFNTGAVNPKTTKDSAGVAVMNLKKGQVLDRVTDYKDGMFAKAYRYKTKNLPGAGALLSQEDAAVQLTLD